MTNIDRYTDAEVTELDALPDAMFAGKHERTDLALQLVVVREPWWRRLLRLLRIRP